MNKFFMIMGMSCLLNCNAYALKITMRSTDPEKTPIGTLQLSETRYGVVIKPDLANLPPGPHGFHLHIYPSCEDQGMAAGGHFDPHQTGKHLGPRADGHLGDLPLLMVTPEGKATKALLAPRLKIRDFNGRSLMIHRHGDNYSDTPEKLGGGGERIACGVVGSE